MSHRVNTMTRMITEERSEMGAMTSIGISNRRIINHYVIYILSMSSRFAVTMIIGMSNLLRS